MCLFPSSMKEATISNANIKLDWQVLGTSGI